MYFYYPVNDKEKESVWLLLAAGGIVLALLAVVYFHRQPPVSMVAVGEPKQPVVSIPLVKHSEDDGVKKTQGL